MNINLYKTTICKLLVIIMMLTFIPVNVSSSYSEDEQFNQIVQQIIKLNETDSFKIDSDDIYKYVLELKNKGIFLTTNTNPIKYLNIGVYKEFITIVYGERHGEVDKFGQRRYLGYDIEGNDISNDNFQNDKNSNTDLRNKNWIFIDEDLESWKNADSYQTNWILYKNPIKNDKDNLSLSIADILENKAKTEDEKRKRTLVQVAPTFMTNGSVRLRHKPSNSGPWYDTFTIPKFEFAPTCKIATDKELYTIPADKSSIDVDVTITSIIPVKTPLTETNLDLIITKNDIIFKDKIAHNRASEPSTKFKMTLQRDTLKTDGSGKATVPLTGYVQLGSIYGDNFDKLSATKTITVIVQNPITPTATITPKATPDYTLFKDNDIPITVNIQSQLNGCDPGKIEKIEVYARKLEDTKADSKVVTVSNNVNTDFKFTIPKDKLTAELSKPQAQYKQDFYASVIYRYKAPYTDSTTKQPYTIVTGNCSTIVGKEAPPPSKADPNLPPIADIQAPSTVIAGEDFTADGSGSHDADGTIASYDWDTYDSCDTITGSIGTLWYSAEGYKTISLTVKDDKGASGSTEHPIYVEAPRVSPALTYTGALKENRKFTLINVSSTPTHFPLVAADTSFSITGGGTEDIKYSGTLIGVNQKDILIKKPGTYNGSVFVRNTAGYSGTAYMELPIAPDIPPVADFSVPTTVLRDAEDSGYAKLTISDTSYSKDGDYIGSSIFSFYYDSDNKNGFDNGNISIDLSQYSNGQTKTISAPWGESIPVTLYKEVGKAPKIDIKVKIVGKYKVEQKVTEAFGQATIPEYINASEYRTDDTSDKPIEQKTIEVINIAPNVDFTTIKKNKADIELSYDSTMGLTGDQLQSIVNSKLIPKLAAANIEANIGIAFGSDGVSIEDNAPQGSFTLTPNPSLNTDIGEIGGVSTGASLVLYKKNTSIGQYFYSFGVYDYINLSEVKRFNLQLKGELESKINSPYVIVSEDGTRIYLATYNGYIDCIDIVSGSLVWEKYIDSGAVCSGCKHSYIMDNKLVYETGISSDRLLVLNADTGQIITNEVLSHSYTYAGLSLAENMYYDYRVEEKPDSSSTLYLRGYSISTKAVMFEKAYPIVYKGHAYYAQVNQKGIYFMVLPKQRSSYDPSWYYQSNVNSYTFDLQGNVKSTYKIPFGDGQGGYYTFVTASNTHALFYCYNNYYGFNNEIEILDFTNGNVVLQYNTGSSSVGKPEDFIIIGEYIHIVSYYENIYERRIFEFKNSIYQTYNTGKYLKGISRKYGTIFMNRTWNDPEIQIHKLAKLKREPSYLVKKSWLDNREHFSALLTRKNDVSIMLNIYNLAALEENNVYFVGLGTSVIKPQMEGFILQCGGSGTYIDNTDLDAAITKLGDYIIETAGKKQPRVFSYILAGEDTNVTPFYVDYENDPQLMARWKYDHDPSCFDNSNGIIPDSGVFRDTPYTVFDQIGKYTISYQARDNPKDGTDFDGYKLWSDVAEKILYVHRRPIAQFGAGVIYSPTTGSYTAIVTDSSYDLDHTSRADKGIVEAKWQWKEAAALLWNDGQLPASLPAGKTYMVKLEVKDMENVWSEPCIRLVRTAAVNLPPVAQFILNPNPLNINKTLNVNDTSFDPNGDPIAERIWTIEKADVMVYQGAQCPTDYKSYGTGTYTVTLRVRDNPQNGTSLWSEPYSQALEVIPDENIPPALTANPESRDWGKTAVTVTLTATDKDSGIKEISYKWSNTNDKPVSGWTSDTRSSFSISQSNEGIWYIHVTAYDKANPSNSLYRCFGPYKIDKTPPAPPAISCEESWTNVESVAVQLSSNGKDILGREEAEWSGIKESRYSLTGASAQGWTVYDNSLGITNEGITTINAKTIDNALNESAAAIKTVKIERKPPTITANPISKGWSNTGVNVAVSVTDTGGSGFKYFRYLWTQSTVRPTADESWITADTSNENIIQTNEGEWYLHIEAFDNAGNSSYAYFGKYQIDTTAPLIEVSPSHADEFDFKLTADVNITDAGGSGFKEFKYAWSSSRVKPATGWSNAIASSNQNIDLTKEGEWYLHIEAWDNAGNSSYQNFGIYKLTMPKIDIDYKAVPKLAMHTPTIPTGEKVSIVSASNTVKGIRIIANIAITGAELQLENPAGTFTKICDLILTGKTTAGADTIYQYSLYDYTLPQSLKDGAYNLRVAAHTSLGFTKTADSSIQVYTPIWEDYSKGSLQNISNPLQLVPSELILSSTTAFEEKNTLKFVTSKYTNKVKINLAGISLYIFADGKVGTNDNGTGAVSTLTVNNSTHKYRASTVNITTGTYTKQWSFDLYLAEACPLQSDQGTTIAFTGYDTAGYFDTTANKHGLNPRTKSITAQGYILSNFRVAIIRDLYLESYYKNPVTHRYPDKPMDVNEMAIDYSSFTDPIGNVPPGFTGLTKGYMFEFLIDSRGFNGANDTIAAEPHFYTCTTGIPSIREAEERDVYWQDSYHVFHKAGEGGHAKWKTVTLTEAQRTITSDSTATWRGSYVLPGTAFAVPKGTAAEKAKQMFLAGTYLKEDIIVSFQIKGYKDGVMKFDYNEKQWPKERTVEKKPYLLGDVIRYAWDKNNLRDIKTIRNR